MTHDPAPEPSPPPGDDEALPSSPDPETTDQRTLARWHARKAASFARPTHQRVGQESQQDYRQRMTNAQVHALVALALTMSGS